MIHIIDLLACECVGCLAHTLGVKGILCMNVLLAYHMIHIIDILVCGCVGCLPVYFCVCDICLCGAVC